MFIQFTFHSITPPEAPFCNCAAILSPFVLTEEEENNYTHILLHVLF